MHISWVSALVVRSDGWVLGAFRIVCPSFAVRVVSFRLFSFVFVALAVLPRLLPFLVFCPRVKRLFSTAFWSVACSGSSMPYDVLSGVLFGLVCLLCVCLRHVVVRGNREEGGEGGNGGLRAGTPISSDRIQLGRPIDDPAETIHI